MSVQQNSEPVQQPQQPPQSQPPRQYFKIENPDQARQQIEEYHMNRNQLIQSQQVPVNQEQVEQQQQQPQFVVVNPRQQPQPHLGGLIPPNRSTLVGMKGFLMCLKRLKKVFRGHSKNTLHSDRGGVNPNVTCHFLSTF